MDTHLKTRWASAPGETIAAVLAERGMSAAGLAQALGTELPDVERLLEGRVSITVALARGIADVVGGTTQFWLAREAQYVDSLDRMRADQWAQTLPVAQMAKFGWIDNPADWLEQIRACLQFFDVTDVDEWNERHLSKVRAAHFRTSPTFQMHLNETATWFYAAEHAVADRGKLPRFDRPAFESAMADVRSLMRIADPKKFIPRLEASCAAAGVRVVVVPAPKGCPASGAARIVADRPLIQLSARHLTEDHFWFSFFHEAGHVLNDDLTGGGFVDVLDAGDSNPIEVEANRVAEAWLLGSTKLPERVRDHREIARLAMAAAVPPGVMVGQLQHRGVVRRETFNFLKRGYRWNGSSLETKRKN